MLDHRDFSDQMSEYRMDEPLFRANHDFMIISGDSGRAYRGEAEVAERTPASSKDAHERLYDTSLRRELHHLESRLREDEYFKYEIIKERVGSVSEQIYYLRLSESERKEYLRIRKIKNGSPATSNTYKRYGSNRVAFYDVPSTVFKNDVIMGMSKEDVSKNWGSPVRRDVAGKAELENERWAFRRGGVVKYIYFEDGKVQGWSEE